MNTLLRRFLPLLLLSFGLGFAYFVVVAVLRLPGGRLLEIYRVPWIVRDAANGFFLSIVPLTAFASAVTYSFLTIGTGALGLDRTAYIRSIQGSLVLLILVGLAFAFVVALAAPANRRATNTLFQTTELAESFLDEAEEAFQDKRYLEAETRFRDYLEIDPTNRDVQDRLVVTLDRRTTEAEASADATTGEETAVDIQGLTRRGTEYLGRAEQALESEDPHSAYYFADLALTIQPELEEAATLRAEAERLITADEELDRQQENYFQQKRRAEELFEQEELPQAYYLIQQLFEERPEDPDLERLLPQVEAALEDQYFFIDEMSRYLDRVGSHNIVFVNRSEPGLLELVSIRKVIRLSTEVYGWDVEVVRLGPAGEKTAHFRAPYAKSAGNGLTFRAVYRDPESETELIARSESLLGLQGHDGDGVPTANDGPTADGGAPAATETGDDRGEAPMEIELSIPPEDLGLLELVASDLRRGGLGELLRLRELPDYVGYSLEGVDGELLRRLTELLALLALPFAAASVGWSLRVASERRPRFVTYIPLAVLPFLAAGAYELYSRALAALTETGIGLLGFVGTLVVLVVLHVLVLFVSLVSLAGRAPQ